jgi:hypothetical protein
MSFEVNPTKFRRQYRAWGYKNTTALLLSLVVFFYFAESTIIQNLINKIGEYGYVSAFIAGIFFVSTFTVTPAAVVLFNLAHDLNPYIVAILAGIGAVIGDYVIFRFLRDNVFEELKPFFLDHGGSYIARLFHSPYFVWLFPVFGALIIASPLPDEAGVSLLSLSKLKNWQFILLSFILNATGIFIVVMLSLFVA